MQTPNRSMKHGWLITKDHIADSSVQAPSNLNAPGMTGPRDLTATLEEIQAHGCPFKLYDDDGNLYYEGFVLGEVSAPLRDFGMPNAGCTWAKVLVDGKWMTV